MIKQIQKLVIIIGLWLLIPLLLLITHPEKLPLPFLMLPFLLLAIALYVTADTGLKIVGLKKIRRRSIAGVIAILPTVLLVLSSIRQLTIRDIAIVAGLVVLLSFYIRKIDVTTS